MILVSGLCQSDQQSLLLQMKNSLTFDSTLSVSLVQWNQSTDCCTWSGVDCDMAGRVISLDLRGESICGLLPPSMGYLTRLEYLDLSSSNFNGPLPPSMGNLTRLEYLDLSSNNFNGPLPPSMGNLTRLEYLYLSSNSFSGPLPPSMGNLTRLEYLYLSFNSFTGPLPPSMGNLTQLEHLDLSSNSFSGPLPPSMGNLTRLEYLVLSFNSFSGPLPMSIFEIKSLRFLLLASNKFNGTVQLDAIGRLDMLRTFDLSYNNLAVNVNSSFSSFPPHIWQLKLASCKLVMIPNLKKISSIAVLDLSDNHISGEIPNWIWEVVCGTLSLSHNSLVGFQEPYSIKNLDYLDLHSNRLQGKIPLPPLEAELVDYSGNNFSSSIPDDIVGRIPISTQLQSFSPTSFEGNEGLCGPPLMKSCTNSNKSPIPAPTNESDPSAPSSSNEFDWQFFLVIGVGFGTSFVAVVAPLIFSNKVNLCHVVLVAGQCQSDQQSLLLQLKRSLKFDFNRSVHLVKWGQNTECCNWSGVYCDGGGRVTGLNLSFESISGGIENSTGLFSLQHLRSLDLAYNRFNASQIPSRFANLTNLTYLNLSNAGFVGQIPTAISRMTRLVTLDLSTFSFSGIGLLKLENPNLKVLVQNLTELRELHLDGINISANRNDWCHALSSSLPDLQVLSLSGCFLSGPIHRALVSLQLLSVIRLDQNNLSSSVPDFFADFSNLTFLGLSSCGLNGKFPEEIFRVPTLETLDLSNNVLLGGSLPDFPENLSLRTLNLFQTNFSGTLPDSIGNLKKLSRIELPSCNFSGPIPTPMSNLTELVYLDLSTNNFSGKIPSFHMSKNLTYLDLSHNVLSGGISFTEWKGLRNLVYVDLRFNSFNGIIPPSLFELPSLQKLQLANNQFDGQLHDFLTASSSVLDTIDLSGNRLEGPIPKSVFEINTLNILLLSSNKFNGTVQLDTIQRLRNLTRLELSYNSLTVNASSDSPFLSQITTLKLASCNLSVIPNLKNQLGLFHLDLSQNQISEEVPNWIWNVSKGSLIHLNLSCNLLKGLQEPYSLPNLSVLDLHYNQLQGKIPPPPATAAYVDYSRNSFTSIPADIGNFLTTTLFLSLSNNSLSGVIPESICNATYLQVLDLSSNNLSGMVPTCLNERMEGLVVLNLRRNNLNGTISGTFPGNCGLQTLDLNDNQIEGMVPKSLASCTMLEVLDLGNNQINDTFPCWLKTVSSLRVLVLRSNRFYGDIGCPEVNGTWPRLQIVDLASNNFGGKIPGKALTTWHAMFVDEDEAQPNFKHLQFEVLGLSGLYYLDSITVTSKGPINSSLKNLQSLSVIRLDRNNLSSPVPDFLAEFPNLTSLHLSNCGLHGKIPEKLFQVQSLLFKCSKNLTRLELSHNSFSGAISSTDWEQLLNLVYVDLRYNSLNGSIPPSLLALSSLQQLQLGHNQFESQIPEILNASSSLLDTLDLSSNKFEGTIPMSVFELKRLHILLLSYNKFNGTIHLDAIQRIGSLTRLNLSYNKLAVNVSGSDFSFPPWISTLILASCKLSMIPNLRNQSLLSHLDLSDNQISGEIPNWIWEVGNGSLTHLNLSRNSLVGLQEPFCILPLSVLDLHSNWLQGKIPLPPPFAVYVDYSNNNFSNSIPHDIVLDLSSNNLSGSIPACLIQRSEYLNDPIVRQNNLGVLNVRRNSLNGTISDKFPANYGLRTLNMNGNQLEGSIPKSLANCGVLEVLDLGNNHINDAFPCWLKNVSSLCVLVL
ncbi:hypothetical protein LWI29_007062 [Acer saccharum]|uniref:Leucine-rich repeat-containing N-terminal plant-type domain-containing protein n=1 Tax=Acer saccharum TaxID=4024 RepID=A0AA39VM00_ACESA|nr:hypothetical protein LWI29_007062 [Acer saccharum]